MSRGPPNTEGMTSLKVDNLAYRTSGDTLKRTFERYGDVGDVYIPRDPHTGDSRGFAFVRYYDKLDADDAIDALDGKLLEGRELRVQMAKYGRPSSDSRRPAQRSRYGGDSYRRGRYGRSRSRSRSPDRRRRRSPSRSRSRSPTRQRNARASPSKSRSRSPGRNLSKSPSRSRSRSRS